MREVKEETGIETEFVSLLCFRHMHQFRWGNSDFFFICLLKPLTVDVVIDRSEISEYKWIKVCHNQKIKSLLSQFIARRIYCRP